jgi:uncharacterized membrane protein YagU involved in acid resistance
MRPNVAKALLGGFIGTLAITFMMYVVSPLLMGKPMDVAAMLGDFLGIGRTGGMVVHFINGTFIFPLFLAFLLWNVLPGGPTAKGTVWGLILWFLAQTIVMPMMGGGFFSANAGGMMAVGGSLIGHLVYGALLGVITGPARPQQVGIEKAA